MNKTICRYCGWLVLEHADGVVGRLSDEPIWYEMLCGSAPLSKGINPLTGHEESYVGDEEDALFVGQEFEYCRDRNRGHCPDFVDARDGGLPSPEGYTEDDEPRPLPKPREGHALNKGEL